MTTHNGTYSLVLQPNNILQLVHTQPNGSHAKPVGDFSPSQSATVYRITALLNGQEDEVRLAQVVDWLWHLWAVLTDGHAAEDTEDCGACHQIADYLDTTL